MFALFLQLILASTILAAPSAQSSNGQPIHFDNQNKCLTVSGSFANGTPVQLYGCNGSSSQLWVIMRGSTKVQLAGTSFCLDGGDPPSDGAKVKIMQCNNNLREQQWYYTDNNNIELENRGLCLELGNLLKASSHNVQTWTCSGTNKQVWNL